MWQGVIPMPPRTPGLTSYQDIDKARYLVIMGGGPEHMRNGEQMCNYVAYPRNIRLDGFYLLTKSSAVYYQHGTRAPG